MSIFVQFIKIVFIFLLWPIGLLAGFVLADSDSMDILSRRSVMFTLLFLAFVAGISICIAALIGEKAGTRKRRHRFLQWASICFWLPVGIFPGLSGFGWRYLLFATILPSITIYYLFYWQRIIVMKKSESNDHNKGP